MKHKLLFTFLLFSFAAHSQTITTIVGNGTGHYNGDNISALDAGIVPIGVAVDGIGNIYIADEDNNRIRKINVAGIITTIAGTGVAGYSGNNGPATAAEINFPGELAFDRNRNLYFCDQYNNYVHKIDTSGIITTIAGNGTGGYSGDYGPATAAKLSGPFGIAIDNSGNIYIADLGNSCIRKINSSGIITTIAGTGIAGYSGDNGPATAAQLKYPRGIAFDTIGNLYIADCINHCVRKIDITGIITTFAGTGIAGYSGNDSAANAAKLDEPYGIAIDVFGNIYISDASEYSTIRKVSTDGVITTIAGGYYGYSGDNGPAIDAQLSAPTGIALDSIGNMYIADFQNARIRFINSILFTGIISKSEEIAIYPNPVITMLYIQSASPVRQISIANILGQIVYYQLLASNAQSVKIDVSELPPGLYFIKVDESEVRKFIKE
jgi:sugar lactone lactonase YvrE